MSTLMIQIGKASGRTFPSDGADLEGRNSDLSTFSQVIFPTPFPDGFEVVVHVQTQTFQGADTPGIRIANVTTTGFLWRMNEIVFTSGSGHQALSQDGYHGMEDIGWVAYGSPLAPVPTT